MVWKILICALIEAATILGAVWFGHWITMRAFSYNHPMTGNLGIDTTEPSVSEYYLPGETEPEEPDDVLQAVQSIEALEKMGVDPSDSLGPGVRMFSKEEEDA